MALSHTTHIPVFQVASFGFLNKESSDGFFINSRPVKLVPEVRA